MNRNLGIVLAVVFAIGTLGLPNAAAQFDDFRCEEGNPTCKVLYRAGEIIDQTIEDLINSIPEICFGGQIMGGPVWIYVEPICLT